MNLDQLRTDIDKIDRQLLDLFVNRMRLCQQVADYKMQNGLPVFQSKRENEILEKIGDNSPEDLSNSAKLLFSEIMNISKCLQKNKLTRLEPVEAAEPVKKPVVACPGIKGSYCEQSVYKAFGDNLDRIEYFPSFDDVFEAVDKGKADYGMVALENSTAGGVSDTYDLMGKYDLHIVKRVSIPINHVLAMKKGGDISKLTIILSHEQALHQCAGFIKANPEYKTKEMLNTSIAAKTVADSDDVTLGCICSEGCAKLYGLEPVKRNIVDNSENFTRFICISKKLELPEDADVISICLSLPHTTGSLYRTLTQFAVEGLHILKIESKPLPAQVAELREENFDVIFYMDFEGNMHSENVAKLLQNLQNDMKYYKLLGNYKDMP